MTSNEIITIVISTIALIVSILAISLQYSVREDVRVKATEVELVSLAPTEIQPRTASVVFNLTVYNLGNRPVALERVALTFHTQDFDALQMQTNAECNSTNKSYLVPISRTTHSQLAVTPALISADGLYSEEFVFDLFHFQSQKDNVKAEGFVCIELTLSTAKGTERKLREPIAILDVEIARPDTISIKFETDKFQKLVVPLRVF
jgi:hypothetical protein